MGKVLVTGAGGFIGKALISRLRTRGMDVVPVDSSYGDIASQEILNEFAQQDIEHLFHLAGKIFVPDSWEQPLSYYQTNVMGTAVALEFCRRERIPMTFVSSYLYGNPTCLPISEDDALEANNPYAHSKLLAEDICRFYAAAYQIDVTVIRPFNVYGEGQPKLMLIPSIVDQVMHGQQIRVMDLAPRRDYVHVEDLVDALIATVGNTHKLRVFNIGSGVSYSVAEVIDLIQKCVGTSKPVICEQVERPNEIADVVADCSKAERELGWKCKISFEQGVRRLIESEVEGDSAQDSNQ